MIGSVKREELGPWATYQLKDLEKKREHFARVLYTMLDPKNKLGKWSPHYMPALRDLHSVEMQLDGFRVALDLNVVD